MRSYLKRSPLLCLFIGLTVIASCAPQPSYAETAVGLHIGSVHDKPGFNNINPGVYVNHNGWTAGTYYNSERRQSYYAGYTFESAPLYGSLRGALTIGAITGYGKPMVLAVPSISASNPLLGGRTRLSLAVATNKNGANALHLSHEWSF